MTKSSSPDRHLQSQTRAAWVSAISAIISIAFSLLALYQSYQAQSKSSQERILLEVSRYSGDYDVDIKDWGGRQPLPGVLSTYWECLVANNGDAAVSLTSYDVGVASSASGPLSYTGLNQGLFDQDLRPLTLPLNLEPGKGTKLFIRLGIALGPKAYQTLKEAEQNGIPHTITAVNKALAAKRLDVYDNSTEPFFEGSKVAGFKVFDMSREQLFLITFRSARGAHVSDTTRWYDLVER